MFKMVILVSLFLLGLLFLAPPPLFAGENSQNDLFAPVFVNCPQQELAFTHCDTARFTFTAVSAATGLPSPFVRYRLVSGPGTIDSVTGVWKHAPTINPDSIGTYTIEIGAREFSLETEGLQNCHAQIRLANGRPYLNVYLDNQQGMLKVMPNDTSDVAVGVYDGDWCDSRNLFIKLITPEFSGTAVLEGSGDIWNLRVIALPADSGKLFSVILGATDGLDTTLVQFKLQVLPVPHYVVKIQSVPHQMQGTMVDVPVLLERTPPDFGLNGFDFLVAYDNNSLSFQAVLKDSSALYKDCLWEYFTYRYGANGNCSGGCPSGLIRIVGIADINNGEPHPLCQPEYLPPLPAEMFRLQFLISNDRRWECSWLPIRFFWADCSDNGLSSANSQYFLMADSVFVQDSITGPYRAIFDPFATIPGYNGVPDACVHSTYRTPYVERRAYFYGGGVEVICGNSIDPCLDFGFPWPNLTTKIVLRNYFLYGLDSSSLVNTYGAQCLDFNGDGAPLTLADAVLLLYILEGTPPYPVGGSPSPNVARFARSTGSQTQWMLSTPDTLGAVLLVFAGKATIHLYDPSLVSAVYTDSIQTRVLIAPTALDSFPTITAGPLLDASISGNPATLIRAEAATYDGRVVFTEIAEPTDVGDQHPTVPTSFTLYQNYPNPFNLETVLSFDLPKASVVTLDILNVLGQVLWSKSGLYSAGSNRIIWNGTSRDGATVSSGVYYYRIRTDEVTETKKMLLVK